VYRGTDSVWGIPGGNSEDAILGFGAHNRNSAFLNGLGSERLVMLQHNLRCEGILLGVARNAAKKTPLMPFVWPRASGRVSVVSPRNFLRQRGRAASLSHFTARSISRSSVCRPARVVAFAQGQALRKRGATNAACLHAILGTALDKFSNFCDIIGSLEGGQERDHLAEIARSWTPRSFHKVVFGNCSPQLTVFLDPSTHLVRPKASPCQLQPNRPTDSACCW
jgi:hypothetical protein